MKWLDIVLGREQKTEVKSSSTEVEVKDPAVIRGEVIDQFYVRIDVRLGDEYPFWTSLYDDRREESLYTRMDRGLFHTEGEAERWAYKKLSEVRTAYAKYGDGWSRVIR